MKRAEQGTNDELSRVVFYDVDCWLDVSDAVGSTGNSLSRSYRRRNERASRELRASSIELHLEATPTTSYLSLVFAADFN